LDASESEIYIFDLCYIIFYDYMRIFPQEAGLKAQQTLHSTRYDSAA